MKKTVTIIAIIVTLSTTYGQNLPRPSGGVVEIPSGVGQLPSSNPQPTDAPTLDANYTISIKGNFGDSKPIDVTLSGNGPRFTATLAEPMMHIAAIVTKKKDVFTIAYTIAANLPISTGGNIQYQTTEVQGTYYASLGEAFAILKVGDKALSIQIDETKIQK